jgi:LytS/YehU family sensor histidine kinase
LEEELELVRQYLAVEQARFSDRLVPTIAVDPRWRAAAVPAFAVQHLVENAVRHGIARRGDSGRVDVRADREGAMLVITVADDGAGLPSGVVPRAGHGIENTRERLRTLYGDQAALAFAPQLPHGTIARLTIPYHELVFESSYGERP